MTDEEKPLTDLVLMSLPSAIDVRGHLPAEDAHRLVRDLRKARELLREIATEGETSDYHGLGVDGGWIAEKVAAFLGPSPRSTGGGE